MNIIIELIKIIKTTIKSLEYAKNIHKNCHRKQNIPKTRNTFKLNKYLSKLTKIRLIRPK